MSKDDLNKRFESAIKELFSVVEDADSAGFLSAHSCHHLQYSINDVEDDWYFYFLKNI